MTTSTLAIGGRRSIDGTPPTQPFALAAQHLVTHGVVLGMTGSGKTGLLVVMIEEALRSGVPVLMVDVKGDLANLALAFGSHDHQHFVPWIADDEPRGEGSADAVARSLAQARRDGLSAWNISDHALDAFSRAHSLRVLTPGSAAGEPVHILSSLERRDARWDSDPASARASLSAALSLALRLVGRDADPASSREHVLLSVFAERHLLAGRPASLEVLLADLEAPPISTVGALAVDKFLSKKARADLAASLNALLASPSFAAWREGVSLDPGAWLDATHAARTPATLFSVAHLDDDERALVLGVLLEELLSWVRTLPGRSAPRALVVFDEVYGFLPPHPANPPTRRPLTALLKQARAFGVSLLLATQNPMDLDYRALSNAGLWFIGRLQTDADRERVIEGLSLGEDRESARALADTIKRLPPRWFVARDVHESSAPFLAQTRHTLSWLRGPLTQRELARLRSPREE
jgi:hypothetical protein